MRGDVILFESSGSPTDRLIAWATKGPFVHVEIDLGNDEYIGEHVNGVVRYKGTRGRGTRSFTPNTSQSDIELGLRWAEMQLGKRYGWTDIASDGLRFCGIVLSVGVAGEWDCSDFVTRYLQIARAASPLGEAAQSPNTVSPNDLARAYGVKL